MFDIQLRLCEEMNLNPFIIRETDAEEVFKLIKRRRYYINNKENNKKTTSNPREQRRRVDPRQATWLA